MKPILFFFLTLSLLAHASLINHDLGFIARRDHSKLARRAVLSRRCKSGGPPSLAQPVSQVAPPPPKDLANNNFDGSVLAVQSAKCGHNGATKEPTATGGPNGDEDWLNCGLFDGGWEPPYVTMDQIIAMDLDQALASPDSPFQKCSPFIGLFKQYAGQYGILPIVMVSFALQESSCNPETVGGAGEQGLMQLTKDKCGRAPGGNCRDPDYNIRTGTEFFANILAKNKGSVFLSIGQYNGWTEGITYAAATAAAGTNCCKCQNNVDYIQQTVNAWWQNKEVYTWPRVGKYFNLDICNL